MVIGAYISIITINGNGLNAPAKRHRLAEWIQNKTHMLSMRDPLQAQGNIQTESEGMEKNIPYKWKSNESGVAILISDKIDFKIKTITREKEGNYIMIKG